MRYTPKELIQYIHDEGLTESVINAMFNNNRGFVFSPLRIERIYEKDGKTYAAFSDLGEDPDVEIIDEIDDAAKDLVNSGSDHMYAFAIKYGDETELCLAYAEEAGQEEQALDEVIEIFLTKLGINTKGRLKAVIREGDEVLGSWLDAQERLVGMFGEDVVAKWEEAAYAGGTTL